MSALLFFAPLFKPHLGRFALALLLSLVTLAAGTALLGVSGWFLTATALTTIGLSFNLFAPSAAIRGFSFTRILARYFEKLLGHDATLKLLSDIRRWLFAALFPRLPLPGRSLRHGDLVSRLTADVDALDTVFLLAIGPLLAALVLGGAVSLVLFFVLPGAGWIYLSVLLACVVLVPCLLALATRGTGRLAVEAAAGLRTHVLDALAGHDDIVLFGQQALAARRFAEANARLSALRKRLALMTATAAATVQSLSGLALLGILVLGLAAMEAGGIDGPLLAGLLFAVLGSFEATAMILRAVGKLGTAAASAERLRAVATMPPPIRMAARPTPLPASGAVVFENIGFAWPGTGPVLDNLSLTITPGAHIAIAGPSGSGKSTLLALLLRLCDPGKGRVLFGGVDIRDADPSELHARIALLGQHSPVFLDTVRNNLLIAAPRADDATLWSALRTARLEDTVRAMPGGLDTFIGETGATLSAGQARRLCLARTLLSPAEVIALDEPTAGLDREAEAALLADLPVALAGRTLILVTHAPLPPEARLDRFVLSGGTLTEMRP